MKKLIKIYGERNTNTNYFSNLIALNLDAKEIPGTVPPHIIKLQDILPGNELVRDLYFKITYRNNLGWKHTRIKPVEKLENYKIYKLGINFITITKSPYSWLVSLYKRPYHQYYNEKQTFESFLKSKWKTVGRDNTKKIIENPIILWNLKNRSYLQLKDKNTIRTTTEKIFQDPEKIIEEISSKFSIEKLTKNFVNYESSTKDSSKNNNFYRNYYLTEKWRDQLSSESIQIINAFVDKDLMDFFGYRLLT